MTDAAATLTAAAACRRCGACMEVCPLYQQLGQEEAVARGKLSLLRSWQDGQLPASRRLRRILETCLLCGACTEKCTAAIPVPEVIRAGRTRLFQERGWDWSPALALAHLSQHSASLWPLLAGQQARLDKLRQYLGDTSGLWYRLWPNLTALLSRLPLPAPQPFSLLAPEYSSSQGRLRLAFFVGCGIQVLFPAAGLAFLRLSQRLGYDLLIPPAQECCGLLAASAGAATVAQELAQRFLRVFGSLPCDYIVTLCGSCSYQLKKLPELLPAGPEQEQAVRLAAKVREVSELLVQDSRLAALVQKTAGSPVIVSYHDPCHLRRGQGIWEEPRQLLQLVPGLDWRELPGPGRCCGQGGIFGLCHPQVSQALGTQVWESHRQLGATVVATACSGCLLQLVRLAPPAAAARHFVEILAAGL